MTKEELQEELQTINKTIEEYKKICEELHSIRREYVQNDKLTYISSLSWKDMFSTKKEALKECDKRNVQ